MSDIKFENLDNNRNILSGKTNLPIQGLPPKSDFVVQENQSVELHLSSTHQLPLVEEENTDNERVREVKQLIQSNSYQINTDALAEKLLPHIVKLMG